MSIIAAADLKYLYEQVEAGSLDLGAPIHRTNPLPLDYSSLIILDSDSVSDSDEAFRSTAWEAVRTKIQDDPTVYPGQRLTVIAKVKAPDEKAHDKAISFIVQGAEHQHQDYKANADGTTETTREAPVQELAYKTYVDKQIVELQGRIGNVNSIMNFKGAYESLTAADTDEVPPQHGDLIVLKSNIDNGLALADGSKPGMEYVYSNGQWVELGFGTQVITFITGNTGLIVPTSNLSDEEVTAESLIDYIQKEDKRLRDLLTNETQAARGAEKAIRDFLVGENEELTLPDSYTSTLQYIKGKDKEASDRIDSANQNIKKNADDIDVLKTNLQTANNNIEALNSGLRDEIKARENDVDDSISVLNSNLTTRINSVEEAFITADAQLKTDLEIKLGNEETFRKSADNKLKEDIQVQEARRKALEDELRALVASTEESLLANDASDKAGILDRLEETRIALAADITNTKDDLEALLDTHKIKASNELQKTTENVISIINQTQAELQKTDKELSDELQAYYRSFQEAVAKHEVDTTQLLESIQKINKVLPSFVSSSQFNSEITVINILIEELSERIKTDESELQGTQDEVAALKRSLKTLSDTVLQHSIDYSQIVATLSQNITLLEEQMRQADKELRGYIDSVNENLTEADLELKAYVDSHEQIYYFNPTEAQSDAEVLNSIILPQHGNLAIVTRTVNAKDYKTAYMFNQSLKEGTGAWSALDGNYSAQNVYFDQDIIITEPIGVVTKTDIDTSHGRVVREAAGQSMQEFFASLMAKVKNPEIIYPALSISFSPTNTSFTGEVGSTYSLPVATATLTPGSYSYGSVDNIGDTATEIVAESITLKDSKNTVSATASNKNTLSYTPSIRQITFRDGPDPETITYTATCSYEGSSRQPINNIWTTKAEDGSTLAKIPGNSLTAEKTCTATGYRNVFAGNTDKDTSLTSAAIRKLSKSAREAKNSFIEFEAPTGATRLIVAFNKEFTSAIPTFEYYTMNWESFSGFFVKQDTTVAVCGANNYEAKDYTIYEYIPNAPFDAPTKFRFKLN